MAIRAVVIEDADDSDQTVAVSVSNGRVRFFLQSDDSTAGDEVVVDIRDLMSSVTFLDNADRAPALEEHIRAQYDISEVGITLAPSAEDLFAQKGASGT